MQDAATLLRSGFQTALATPGRDRDVTVLVSLAESLHSLQEMEILGERILALFDFIWSHQLGETRSQRFVKS